MPARKIKKSNYSNTGIIISGKNDVSRYYESSLEGDLIYTLEFDSNVRSYEEQPVTIEYFVDGMKRRYTPDFLIHYTNHTELSASLKPCLVEVKYRADLWKSWKELKPRFKAAIDYAKERDWIFKILTEKEIRTEYQYNARFLLKYFEAEVDLVQMNYLLDLIKEFDMSTPQELIAAAAITPKMQAQYLYTLWHLVANGYIKCDITRKIGMQTEIWANEGLN